MNARALKLALILSFILLFPIANKAESIELRPVEPIPHKGLAIGYTVSREGTISAFIGDYSLVVQIPQLASRAWLTVDKTVVTEDLIIIRYRGFEDAIDLTLNMTGNVLVFDINGTMKEDALTFQFTDKLSRVSENRTGYNTEHGLFYFDWSDLTLPATYSEETKKLDVQISRDKFTIDPRVAITNPDFEAGDLTGWSTVCGAGETAQANSTNPINGSWSARFISNADSDNNCSIEQSVSVHAHYWSQFQVRFENELDVDDGGYKIIGGLNRGSGSTRALFVVTFTAGDGFHAGIRRGEDGDAINQFNTTMELFAGVLYCVELRYFKSTSANDGIATLVINQTVIANVTGFDNNGLSSPNRIINGQTFDADPGDKLEWYVDDNYLSRDGDRVGTCPEGLSAPGDEFTRAFSENLTLSDSPQREAINLRIQEEGLIESMSAGRQVINFRIQTQSMTQTMSAQRQVINFRIQEEILTELTLLDREATNRRIQEEGLSESMSAQRQVINFRIFLDSLNLSDIMDGTVIGVLIRAFLESLSASEAFERQVTNLRSQLETLNLPLVLSCLVNSVDCVVTPTIAAGNVVVDNIFGIEILAFVLAALAFVLVIALYSKKG